MDIIISAFIATSLDGYIARQDGKIDWLEIAAKNQAGEDYGYHAYMDTVSCVVMGRTSFERAAKYSEWPYQGKQVIVLSRNLTKPPADFANKVDVYGGKIELLAVELQHFQVPKVAVEGALSIQSFIRAGLMDEIIITQVPVLIGRGLPLFAESAQDIPLRLVNSKSYASGFVQNYYRFVRRTKNLNN